jgi:hypothetical protein
MDNDTATASQGAGDASGTLSSYPDTAATPAQAPAPAPVEDSLAGLTAPDYVFSLPSWTARDYAAFITGSGAAKLADSGVAPLVAAARGYKRLDETNYATEAKIMRVAAGRSEKGQPARLKRTLMAPGRDGMQMPWYSVADIQVAHRDGAKASPFTYQVRPGVPELNEHNKPIKYEFIASAGTPLDLHPATPVDWIDTTPVVMFAEGLLKGDSALSAYLHANGVPYEQLGYDPRDGDPSERLHALLAAIPETKRVLILSIAGIWNTHQNPVDWREIKLKGREAWIAFDADTGINPHVHAAAFKLSDSLENKSRMEPVMFLSPVVPSDDDGTLAKAGIDDYLAKHGSWDMLMMGLKSRLPDAPPRSDNEYNGAVRVSKDGFTVEECAAVNDGPGGSIGSYQWNKVVELGGRIKAMETRRQPTDDELRTGIFDPNVQGHDVDDSIVEIKVDWTLGGKDDSAIITGPETILHFTPADWVRQKAVIPGNLLRHPAWPPRAAKGEAWLAAIKLNRAEEITQRTRWQQMGWVPVEGSDPVFIIGSQVIGETTEGATVSGVGTGEIPVADMFGVGISPDGDDVEDEAVKASVRKDFQDVIDTYITAGAWKDRSTAALVIAAALRPTIPLRPRATIFLWGPKGKGKAIPVDTKIPVPVSAKFPTGWALNSELELGDEVYAADGTPTAIRTFSDVFEDDVYEFDLSDGRTVRSSSKHLWKVSTAASRAARAASAKKANGSEARRVKAERLREFASTLASGDAAPLPELVAASGFSRNQVSAALTAAGIQYQDVYLSGDSPDDTLTWVDLPVNELAEYVHGRTASFSELAEVQRQVSEGKHYTSGKFGTVRVTKSRVYPVAETLTALADHVEFTRAPMPLEKTVTAESIAADFGTARYGIRAIEAVDGPDAVLPVPAYTLGAWLGDGTSREGGFTNPDAEVIDWIRADGYQVTDCTKDTAWYIRGLMTDLRDLDVLEDKHIPARYLRGSRAQRLALLQGLMDTDGTVSKQGQCELTLTTKRLAYDAVELIRSFGIRASIAESDAAISEIGTRRVVGTRYRIQFTTTEPVFRLARKAARLPEKTLENWVFIEAVRKVGTVPVRCLTVEHHTGMFAQDDFVLSHNSWTAKAMMFFWAKTLSGWQDQLPGSAKDTVAYIETCVSRTPIWVVDDLAPSPIKRQAEAEDGKLADLTRSIFNNATKGRMNADMSARKVNKPIAQLIITAENELTTPSAKERLIPAYIGHGKLAESRVPTDAINELAKERGVPARFTAHLIRFIRRTAISTPGGWAAFFARLEEMRTDVQASTEAIMKKMGTSTGSLERTSSLAADVLLTFEILRLFADELDMDDDFKDLFRLEDGLGRDIISLVSSAHAENMKSSPGTSLVRALSALLASGGAHVINVDDPTVPPIEGTDDSGAMANHRLGWSAGSGSDGKLKPNGPSIGTVVTKNGQKVILFDVETAFAKAQAAYPNLIQHGQGTGSAWASIWDENLNPDTITRQTNSRGSLVNTVRLTVGSGATRVRPTGVPILADTILGGGLNDHDDDIVD